MVAGGEYVITVVFENFKSVCFRYLQLIDNSVRLQSQLDITVIFTAMA